MLYKGIINNGVNRNGVKLPLDGDLGLLISEDAPSLLLPKGKMTTGD